MKSNEELQRDVAAALKGLSTTGTRDVSVAAEGGIVTLRGEVLTFEERERIDRVTRKVAGVTAVINEVVATQDPITLSLDTILAREAVAALRALGASTAAVTAAVDERVVTLSGVVDEESEQNAAREAVALIPGVRSVVDLIRVAGRPDPVAVERGIT